MAGTATGRTGIDRARCSNLSTADRTAGRAGKCAGGGGALVGGGGTAISEGAAAGGGAEAGDAGAELEKAPLREETIIPPLAFKRAQFDRSAGAAEVAAGSAAAIGDWADAEAEEAAPSWVAKRGVNKSSDAPLCCWCHFNLCLRCAGLLYWRSLLERKQARSACVEPIHLLFEQLVRCEILSAACASVENQRKWRHNLNVSRAKY